MFGVGKAIMKTPVPWTELTGRLI
ncbi:uncharacterized protein METZ01_LOCUS181426 [marine metagenome]|uniref:Uncharacterized protein n=1 Tax=marine metagenome TaxID=408172 RepID=A0A382CRX7_9ZZZZ